MKASVTAHKTMHKDIKASWIQALDEMLVKSKATTKGIDVEFKKSATWFQVQTARMKVAWAGTMSFIKTAAATTGKFITKAFSILSWVSILYTMGKAAFDWFKGVRDGGEAVEDTIEPMDIATTKVRELNEEFEKFNAVQRIITEDGHGFLQFFEAMGNKIGSLTSGMQKTLLQDAGEAFKEFTEMTSNEFMVLRDRLTKESTGLLNTSFAGNTYDEVVKDFQRMHDRIETIRSEGMADPAAASLAGGMTSGAALRDLQELSWLPPDSLQARQAIEDMREEYEALETTMKRVELAQDAYNGELLKFMRMNEDVEGHVEFVKFYDDMLDALRR